MGGYITKFKLTHTRLKAGEFTTEDDGGAYVCVQRRKKMHNPFNQVRAYLFMSFLIIMGLIVTSWTCNCTIKC